MNDSSPTKINICCLKRHGDDTKKYKIVALDEKTEVG